MKLIFKDGQELVITRANDTYSYEGYKDGLGNDMNKNIVATISIFNSDKSLNTINCSGYDYQVNGTPDSKATYICVMHKARALGNLYFWNKYYRKNNMNKRMKNYVPDEWALEIISESELNMLKELERED